MKLAIIGAGGHAKEVIYQLQDAGFHISAQFVDDFYRVGTLSRLSEFNPKKYEVLIAVGDCKVRQDIAERLPSNTKFFNFIHPSALVHKDTILGEGCFIGAYCMVMPNVKIGKHTILNRNVHVGHDCQIGNYFSAMAGVVVSGDVNIKDRVYVGNNASIKEKKMIAEDNIIGMNAAVVKDILESGVWVGIPAKRIK